MEATFCTTAVQTEAAVCTAVRVETLTGGHERQRRKKVTERIRAAMTAVSNIIMRCLTASGVRVQSYMYFENWRRKPDCDCAGCTSWRAGNTLPCEHQFLAWKDKSVMSESWSSGTISLWLLAAFCALMTLLLHPIWRHIIELALAEFALVGAFAIVCTAGKNDLLTQYFKGSAYTATWYVGLVDGGTTPTYNAADTMASHAGWTENVGYSNASRVTWTGGAVSGGSVDNSASPASFNMNATGTIAGSFMANNSTKSGTTGTLYSEASFTQGSRSVLSGDTLSVTATETAS
jgi:hypothetical protein